MISKIHSPTIRIYKNEKLVFLLVGKQGKNNYIDFVASSDLGVAQIINKYVHIDSEEEEEYRILYSRIRGKDYIELKEKFNL